MGAVISYGLTSLLDRPRTKEEYVAFLQAFMAQGVHSYFSEVFVCPVKGRKTPDFTAYKVSHAISLHRHEDPIPNIFTVPKDNRLILKKDLSLWKGFLASISYIRWSEFNPASIFLPHYSARELQVVRLPGIEETLSLSSLDGALHTLKQLSKRKSDGDDWAAIEAVFARAHKYDWAVVVR